MVSSVKLPILKKESTSGTNELNAAYSVSTTTGHSSQVQGSSSYADEFMFLFVANQSSSPQLDNEDLEQIDQEDLEEMDLKWQVAMLSMTVKRFYKKTQRKLEFNGKEPVGIDKTKVEYFNCHRRWHFSRDCRIARNLGNSGRAVGSAQYRGRDNAKRPTREEDEKALEEVTETVFDNRSSDEENSLANDRFKKGEGFHAVPPLLTGNYMPPKPDLSFARLDDSIYKFRISETVTSLSKDVKDAPETSTAFIEKPKEVRTNRMAKKYVLPNNVGKGTGHKESRPVWNNVQRINHQNKFAPIAVFTRSGRIPVSASKPKAAASTIGAVKGIGLLLLRPQQGHPQQALKNKGIVDSGCSRHMTRNKAYLADYQEINNEGFVAFGSSRGKITGKASIDESNLWHKRLGHVNFKTMNKLVNGNLVRGLPSKIFENNHTCVACQKGKQHKATCLAGCFSWPLKMKLVRSLNHLAIENQINKKVKVIRCDNGAKFKNRDLDEFYGMKRIKREYSNARTPQQNRVVERKNRTLIEAARTMLANSLFPITFWAEVVNTTCYVLNRALVTKHHNKTPYELLNGRSPRLDFMRPFGCHVTILNTLDPLGNQTDKNAGPQDTNGNAELRCKAEDDKPKDDIGSKTIVKPVNKEDQAYRDKLNKLMSQEKEASNAADSFSKKFEQGCIDQRGAATAASTNTFNTVSNLVNVVSTSGTFSTGRPSSPHPDAFILDDTLLHVDQDDSQITDLEDTTELRSTSIFTSSNDDDLDTFTSLV
nr:hypothetical protein [Tanacetum cinerariifolium]